MNYTAEIRVSEEDAKYFEMLCQNPNDIPRDFVPFYEEVKFENGMIACIQVVSPENPENESSWTQMVLFSPEKDKTRGIVFNQEVACSEVKETFIGEYKIDYNGNKYIVEVLIEDEVVV